MTAKIKLNAASGGGSFSLQAPSSSSNNRIFTLPDSADATLLTSTASLGKILQVVSVTKTGQFSSSSTSFTDITGCTLNITPSSSSNKIFVTLMGGQWGMYTGGSYFGEGNIVRDSTELVHGIVTYREGSGNSGATCSLSFLDSPNTTSQVTYKAQVKSSSSSKEVYPTGSGGEGLTITAMEVAA